MIDRMKWLMTSMVVASVLSLVASGQMAAQVEPSASAEEVTSAGEARFTLYVSIEELKRELDRGADFVLIDARSRGDYLFDHITGAVSMPFFEVDERFSELPLNKWIVAYCACPRAEAERAVHVLQEKGFDQVAVMYEGYFEWRDRGYSTTSGVTD